MTLRLCQFVVKNQGINMARIGLQITQDQKEWLERQAKQKGESVATIIRQILNTKIKEKK